MSVRDYKIMGAGGVLLTGWCPGLEEWFSCRGTGERMCFTYKSKEECVEKIEFILDNYEKSVAIAKNAQKEVHIRHRYVDRVRQILKDTGLLG
jgi:spore maturation protein CgeB